MARVYPFRAWRYNPSAARPPSAFNLDDVLTQPSGKITPAMQQAYYQRSPFNAIRMVLGLPELFDAERGGNVYTRAAENFHAWRQQGVLIREKEPCIYAYAQRFRVPDPDPGTDLGSDSVLERRGFLALGHLHGDAERVVFRHEEALHEPKHGRQSDRLRLLRATRAHFEPAFMLYSDPAGSVEQILYDGSGPADAEVTDEFGVLHRIWRIADPAILGLLTTAMADKKLIVADGQDGYQAALEYADEHGPASPPPAEHSATRLPHPPYPEAAAPMVFVNMDSAGLVILPLHRVVRGLTGFDPAAFTRAAEQFFTPEPISGPLAAADAEACLAALAKEPDAALVAVTAAGAVLLRARPNALDGVPERLRTIAVAQLHSIVLERLLGLKKGDVEKGDARLRCLRDASEALGQVRRGEANAAFLLNPVTIDQIREVAFAGDLLPPNSTDFFPNLLSGLAIYALD
jgi:uncharacterized protein (DUF1015 family)